MIHEDRRVFSFSDTMISQFKFNADGLIPAIVQDAKSRRVLMMAWMNEQSIRMTLEKGLMVYFSRSRQKHWLKGETSGQNPANPGSCVGLGGRATTKWTFLWAITSP